MKPTIGVLVAAFSIAAYSTIAQADSPSVEATEHAAKADYKAAKEQCGALKGNEKDVCLKKAKAEYTAAVEDAKAAQKTTHARAEATEQKLEAEYKVAKEKCDAMSGDAKKACIADAKAQYKQ